MARRPSEINAKDIASLDRTMHEPARLSIAASLYIVKRADFVFLQNRTGMTGGNLSSHIKKLEEAGYVSITKTFEGSRPKTSLGLTRKGRDAFEAYLGTLTAMLDALR